MKDKHAKRVRAESIGAGVKNQTKKSASEFRQTGALAIETIDAAIADATDALTMTRLQVLRDLVHILIRNGLALGVAQGPPLATGVGSKAAQVDPDRFDVLGVSVRGMEDAARNAAGVLDLVTARLAALMEKGGDIHAGIVASGIVLQSVDAERNLISAYEELSEDYAKAKQSI
jgi:hypothetical protein